jgi:NAD(P)-dependent dehydrogenase (short-subunit alcohol dehydrogenase family)
MIPNPSARDPRAGGRVVLGDKIAVMTGATSGIGEVAAEALASRGVRIVFVARDRSRGEATLGRLRAIGPTQDHSVHYGDLSRLGDVKRVADEIAAVAPQIDLLINNAGLLSNTRRVTEDGLELTFATNHMAYFALTGRLRARLAPASRIINTASALHAQGRLDFADLQLTRGYTGMRAYSNSKLCNVLFTRELARRLAGSGITANCHHPGFVATRFGSGNRGPAAWALHVAKYFALTPRQGAQTMIHLATSPDVADISGAYFVKSREIEPGRAAIDDATARRLWSESATLSGMDY